MVKILKKAIVYSFVVGVFLAVIPSTSVNAQASVNGGHCNTYFLTFPAWYNGVNKPDQEGGCDIISPNEVEGGITVFVWRIVLNIVEIMLNMVGYASVAFILYGGYRYMYSAGSPDGMVGARKTILNACVGLVLSILSVAIVNTIAGGLGS